MKTLIIDNYDSFTFNLYQLVAEVNRIPPVVVRNDTASWDQIKRLDFDNIVISPGPGRPEVAADFGICADVIREAQVPVLGVCLGYQGICHLMGGTVDYADVVMHGRSSDVHHTAVDLFAGLPSPFSAVRYHSLYVSSLSDELEPIAWTDDDMLMAVRHRQRPMWGVQFHPESICTEYGHEMFRNFRTLTGKHMKRRPPRRRRSDGVEPPVSAKQYDVLSEFSTESTAFNRPRSIHGKPFKVHVRRLPLDLDPEQVFENFFADSCPAFWLDSALVRTFSRFSYMGDLTGPHAEYVTYDVNKSEISVRHGDRVTELQQDIFSYLEGALADRYIEVEGLPFDFNLGYVGYLGYELKADCGGASAHAASTPDAALIFADRMIAFDHEESIVYLLCLDDEDNDERAVEWLDATWEALQNLRPTSPISLNDQPPALEPEFRHEPDRYLELIALAQKEIRRGETYEVCLTNMLTYDVDIEPLDTYRALRQANSAPYATYLRLPEAAVLSSSPERFLTIEPNGTVESKPIKGTRRRSSSPAEDERLYEDLRTSEKDRSENLMIVDLLRNDIGIVSDVGSVHVSKLFAVESYATVHQLVSTVRGRLRRGLSAVACTRAAFPGGSMTGAPKVRTMEIIDRLEGGPRGIYSGAIGFFGLNGSADLSITIRTIVATAESVTVGVGGAIIDLSDPEEELREILLKAEALRKTLASSAKDRAVDRRASGVGL